MAAILSKIIRGATAVLTKKVTTLEPDGQGGEEEITRTKAREGVKGIGWIAGFLVAWHFVIQPVLAHHFPDYPFPALDFGWISGLFMGL